MDSADPGKFVVDRHEVAVTKEMLEGLQVIGQVDSKFIVTSLRHDNKRYLIVLDQHAVDERLRLEHLQRKFRQELRNLKITKLKNPLKISLFAGDATSKLYSLQKDLRKSLEISGIHCKVHTTTNEMSLLVTDLPLDLLRRIVRKPSFPSYLDYARETIARLALNFTKNDGGSSFGGNFFAHVLASEACARAFKFGDPLSPSTMTNMIAKLAQCDMPFQCAHGRPTLTVVKYDKNN